MRLPVPRPRRGTAVNGDPAPATPPGSESVLLALGHVAPRRSIAAAVELALADEDRALAVLRRHRVLSLAADRLRAAGVPDDSAILAYAADKARRRRRLGEAWDDLAGVCAATGVAMAGIKGLSTQRLYERPTHRDISDIDLMVQTADDAWRMAAWMRSHGWELSDGELPWLKRDSADGRLYGQVRLVRHVEGDHVAVDVHFGGYSVRHCRLLPCELTEPGLHLWDPVQSLPLLLGNAAGDYVVLQKEVNDVTLLLQAGPDLRWDTLRQQVRAVGLERVWNAVLAQVLRSSALDAAATRLAGQVYFRGVPAEPMPFGERDGPRRTRATVFDTVRASRGVRRLTRALGAYRYYSAHLELSAVATCGHNGGAATLLDDLRNDVCVRLVEPRLIQRLAPDGSDPGSPPSADDESQPIAGSTELRQVRRDGHTFLVAAGDTFATTVWYDLCPVQIRGVLNPAHVPDAAP
jgi:hypothetical protein